jgi:hypothetical protein
MRARVIIKEITIRKQGEVQFFQIRLPKNATRIIGVDTDVFLLSALEPQADGNIRPDKGNGVPPSTEVNRRPFLQWTVKSSPAIGKLKLQTMDRHSIFFDTWLSFIYLNSAMPDMRFGLYPRSPYSLMVNSNPKPVSIPVSNTTINGLFTDAIGQRRKSDTNYRVKVFLWIETSEPDNGVQYDFEKQKQSTPPRP